MKPFVNESGSQSRSYKIALWGIFFIILIAACTPPAQPAPTPADEVMLSEGNLPKIIVTIDLTPRPSATTTAVTADQTATRTPIITPTLGSAQPTPSPTRYVGVFLGEPTSIGPGGEVSIPPTIDPIIPQAGVNASGIIAPQVISPVTSSSAGVGNCQIPVADAFANAYQSNPSLQAFGCPVGAGISTALVTQRFERGRMFWRDTRQIIVMADGGTFWRTPDSWNEGMAVDDPALAPPEGMSQPVRGFGLVWRTNPTFRDALGWALGPEFPISSYWQDFSGGTLFLGDGGQIYAVPSGETGQFIGGISQ